ncbi:ADP-ribosylglycohydrolase [Antricoccus suffuscus]|uniref:ADP-ribosylglycohydrolase n=1 Tax=Antricoccus suffuscus TaxID=1629062 RepID=A0A2T0ZZX2_9ACTN|nr:ADP-ribosylglycohydrolase family protein [Antricoccus suffuscus]PRZ41892.1 ADP-ribosylglycohydrolase [Antricoccus suffuscus]
MSIRDRALGAMTGLALGDALGMPTQAFNRSQIFQRYGAIDGLRDATADQPIAPSMQAGSVTDDTEQAILVAGLLIDGHGTINPESFSKALIAWESSMRERGSRDLLGPSTKAAIDAIVAGDDPSKTGRYGTTNGAAMRITPVAIATPTESLIKAVVESSYVTHNTGLGISGAAAIAGAVGAGIDCAPVDHAIQAGLDLAEQASQEGHWIAGASIAARGRWALRAAADLSDAELLDFVEQVIGTSVHSQESVVAALLLAYRYRDRPYEGLCQAAALGGDTDTIAAMCGAVLGASLGASAFPQDTVTTVLDVSRLKLAPVVDALLDVRRSQITPR